MDLEDYLILWNISKMYSLRFSGTLMENCIVACRGELSRPQVLWAAVNRTWTFKSAFIQSGLQSKMWLYEAVSWWNLKMAVLEPGPCIKVICVTYILIGLATSDTILCLGGLVGLIMLKKWTTETPVKEIVTKSDTDTDTSHLVTRHMRKNSRCDIVTINSDLMTSGNKAVNPARKKLSYNWILRSSKTKFAFFVILFALYKG